jgi:hypothetical protein
MFEVYINGLPTGLTYRSRRLAAATARDLSVIFPSSSCYVASRV